MADEQTLVSHLVELRSCLMRAVSVTLIIFACMVFFANDLYHLIATPLIDQLPENSSMIATEVVAPFLTPIKLAFFVALFIAMPYVLYEAWSFVAPGLYKEEKRLAISLLVSSIILFYLGVAFSFFIVFPVLFTFIPAMAPEGVIVMPDISNYLNTVLKLFFGFGLAFEVPILTIILLRTGIVYADSLRQKRPYIIIAAFVVGMLLTPPDIISQSLLAIPVWLLFELGLWLGESFFVNDRPSDFKSPDLNE